MDNLFDFCNLNFGVLLLLYHHKQILTFVCLAAVLAVGCYYVDYKIKRRRLERIVNQYDGPKGLPIVGNITFFMRSPIKILNAYKSIMAMYKSPLKLWLLHVPFIIISTPEDFETVAFKTLEKESRYRYMVDLVGDGIFTSRVERWKRIRRVLNPAFNPAFLFHYFLQIFNDNNIYLINLLKKEVGTGKQFDLWPYFSQISVMTICGTAMGYKDTNDAAEIMKFEKALSKSAKLVSERFFTPWLMPSCIFTIYKYLMGYRNAFNIILDFPLKMLRKQRELLGQMKKENHVGDKEENITRNFLNILLNFQKENASFTDEQLLDEVRTILATGSETTSLINAYCMMMLGMRQDVQEKVYQELFEVFGEGNRLPEIEDMAKLQYLEQCIKETLRLFSIVPIVMRHPKQDIQISNGNIIPAGCSIMLSIYGIHHNPEIYPDPGIWNPGNFDPDKVADRHKYSFVGFSIGPRGCIANKYAMISMKAQLSTLIRNFKITTDFKMQDIEFYLDFVIRSTKGYQIKLDYRHGESLF